MVAEEEGESLDRLRLFLDDNVEVDAWELLGEALCGLRGGLFIVSKMIVVLEERFFATVTIRRGGKPRRFLQLSTPIAFHNACRSCCRPLLAATLACHDD